MAAAIKQMFCSGEPNDAIEITEVSGCTMADDYYTFRASAKSSAMTFRVSCSEGGWPQAEIILANYLRQTKLPRVAGVACLSNQPPGYACLFGSLEKLQAITTQATDRSLIVMRANEVEQKKPWVTKACDEALKQDANAYILLTASGDFPGGGERTLGETSEMCAKRTFAQMTKHRLVGGEHVFVINHDDKHHRVMVFGFRAV